MDKFQFLLGTWDLEYRIPESKFSPEGTDLGTGKFERMLNDKYVSFEYSTDSGGAAKGIFGWDDKSRLYRYWWFENSGNFLSATCEFTDEETLAMNWHDSLLVQTFSKVGPDKVILKMQYPFAGGYETVLEVILKRNRSV